jgi:hypothetical protein
VQDRGAARPADEAVTTGTLVVRADGAARPRLDIGRLGIGLLAGALVVVTLWALVELTLFAGSSANGTRRAGIALGVGSAALLAVLVGWYQSRAVLADAAASRPASGSPVLMAVAVSFLLKLFLLGSGTVVLMYSGQVMFHPFAFAIAFAGASVILQVAITWMVVKPVPIGVGAGG